MQDACFTFLRGTPAAGGSPLGLICFRKSATRLVISWLGQPIFRLKSVSWLPHLKINYR